MNRRSAITRSYPRGLALLVVIALLVVLSGCENPNKIFEGVWQTTDTEFDELGGQFVGAPTLAIGHYGTDLTGLVFFQAAAGTSGFTETCPCALIEQQIGDGLDLVNRQVSFSSTCEEPDVGSVPLDWELTMGEEDDPEERTLSGTVQRSDGFAGIVDVHFQRVRLEIGDDDKQCPPE